MTPALAHLRKLAEAAKPDNRPNWPRWPNLSEQGDYGALDPCEANFEFIKRASPQVVLLLLDLVEAADEMRRAGTYVPPEYGTGPTDAATDYDTARAALEAEMSK